MFRCRLFIVILFFISGNQLFAQQVPKPVFTSITGKAPFYAGKEIVCTSYKDYLSFELKEEARTKVDSKGWFSLAFEIKNTKQLQLHCGGAQAMLYADPGQTYKVVVNKADSSQSNAYRQNVRIDFDTLPIHDINNLILDFNSRHDDFIFYNFTLFGKQQFQQRLDTFKLYLSKVYKDVKHPYFATYAAYSVAETELIGLPRQDENSFTRVIFGTYIFKKPVVYENDKYMNFFTKFYSDVFKMIPVGDEMDLFRAINKYGSPVLAKRVLSKDILMREDVVCELALLKSLGQEYYNDEFDKDMILSVLDSINLASKHASHREMAANIKKRLMYLQTGSKAPEFLLADHRDSLITMDKFKGKFVYLMFWSIDNVSSMNEMKMMKNMYEKYKWDIEFISVNVDNDPQVMKNFVKKNKYSWTFVHHGKDTKIRDKYNVTALPQYYLIDPERTLIQAPALRPIGNSTYKSIEETFHRIHKKLHPEKKHIPGQKED